MDAGIANLDPALAIPLIVERGLGAARAAVRYLRELVALDVEDAGDRDRLLAGGRRRGARDGALGRVSRTSGQAGPWHVAAGRGALQPASSRSARRSAYDARSLRDRGQAEFDRLDAEMRTLARDATGNDDWREVLRENDEDHPPTEEAMRQAYADWTERARQFLAR